MKSLFRLLAVMLGLMSLFMIPSLIAACFENAVMIRAFAIPLGIAAIPALLVLLNRRFLLGIDRRDAFLLVFLTWACSSLLGSVPYMLAGSEAGNLSFSDAVLESTSGFATTGCSVIADIEALPFSLLLWRSLSYWAGGMGIILLTVALLPLLGVGGFQLIKAEAPGTDSEKISPRITASAKILWGAYVSLTALLIMLYRAGGMNWFDAVCHGMTTISSGGASTRNQGLSFYNSVFIDGVATLFMLLSAVNFNMYFRLVKGKFRDIIDNTEIRVFFCVFFAAALVMTWNRMPIYGSFGEAWRYAAFDAASVLSTTGAGSRTDYAALPGLSQAVLFCLMLSGGCSGSTAGGIKIVRHAVLFKQAANELRRILYPLGVFSIRLNKKIGRKDIVYGCAGFVCLYFLTVAITALVTAASGQNLFSSVAAGLGIVGNIGSGFGSTGRNFAAFPNYLKWFYSLVMIAGRLELWTVLVLFTPGYWRR